MGLINMTKSRKITCINCKTLIFRSVAHINENLKLGRNFYCSLKCQSQYLSQKKSLPCENNNCSNTFSRSPKEISCHNYCSRSCAIKINNRKFPKRKALISICQNDLCGREFKGVNKYCSRLCVFIAKRKYTSEELIEIIQKVANKLGRTPAKREIKEVSERAIKLFGSWNKAIIAAGLQPLRSHSQRMYKRTNTKAKDGHICDSISEALVDNWLTEKEIVHKRNFPYPKTGHRADWAILDGKLLIEYFGLAKDSPRYDRTIRRKKAICRRHKLQLVAIYPDDLYPKNRLDEKLKSLTSLCAQKGRSLVG